MKLTWMGTACFVLESGDQRILFDPFLELAGGTTAVSEEELLACDTIFVTHCHFDHLYEAQELVAQGGGNVSLFCTKQCCSTLEGFLEDQSNVAMIRPGETYDLYDAAPAVRKTRPAAGSDGQPAESRPEAETAGRMTGASHPQPGEPGFVRIRVLQGRHIEFQKRHVMETMHPLRLLRYAGNLPWLFWANRTFQEAGEIVAFDVHAEGREILILGSLALDPEETYPEGVDVLVLPYQGSNDLPARAREVLERLRPKAVLLSHFDNAFPPMSRDVDLRPLKKLIREEFPQIRVVRPTAFSPVEL